MIELFALFILFIFSSEKIIGLDLLVQATRTKRFPLVVFVLFFLISCNPNKNINSGQARPNVIVIVADDLGWNDIGYHGSEINTPHLDKMANEGIEFDRFYVHPVCSSTRASLLTGNNPAKYGIYAPLGDEPGLPPGTITLAGLLKQNGYETAISGKWHLGAVPKARPMNYGFDSSYGFLRGQVDPYTHLYKTGDRTWHRNDILIDEEGHATDLITEEAVRFITKPREMNTPFFLYIAYGVPHHPLDESDEWVIGKNDNISNESRRLFAASVTHMDHSIGQIISSLKEREIEENTVIFFVSDNGGHEKWYSETLYNGKFKKHDVLGDNTPLRGWKRSLYEGAIRVPALLYWKGKVNHKIVAQNLIISDVFPTIAYITRTEIPEELNVEGLNFWPVVENDVEIYDNRGMYWISENSLAIIKDDWKLIHFGENINKGKNELYNITSDPYEKKDVSSEYPKIVSELKRSITTQMSKYKN